MNPERFARVRDVLLAVLASPPQRRERRLDEECAGDPDLGDEIRSLLRSRGRTVAILDKQGVRAALAALLAEKREG